jgi:hypothetical protein
MPKWIELLADLVSQARVIAVLVNPNAPNVEGGIRDMQEESGARKRSAAPYPESRYRRRDRCRLRLPRRTAGRRASRRRQCVLLQPTPDGQRGGEEKWRRKGLPIRRGDVAPFEPLTEPPAEAPCSSAPPAMAIPTRNSFAHAKSRWRAEQLAAMPRRPPRDRPAESFRRQRLVRTSSLAPGKSSPVFLVPPPRAWLGAGGGPSCERGPGDFPRRLAYAMRARSALCGRLARAKPLRDGSRPRALPAQTGRLLPAQAKGLLPSECPSLSRRPYRPAPG